MVIKYIACRQLEWRKNNFPAIMDDVFKQKISTCNLGIVDRQERDIRPKGCGIEWEGCNTSLNFLFLKNLAEYLPPLPFAVPTHVIHRLRHCSFK